MGWRATYMLRGLVGLLLGKCVDWRVREVQRQLDGEREVYGWGERGLWAVVNGEKEESEGEGGREGGSEERRGRGGRWGKIREKLVNEQGGLSPCCTRADCTHMHAC